MPQSRVCLYTSHLSSITIHVYPQIHYCVNCYCMVVAHWFHAVAGVYSLVVVTIRPRVEYLLQPWLPYDSQSTTILEPSTGRYIHIYVLLTHKHTHLKTDSLAVSGYLGKPLLSDCVIVTL